MFPDMPLPAICFVFDEEISKKILTSVGGRLDYGSHFDIINIYVGVGGSFLLHFVKGCREDQFVGYYMSRNDVGYDKFLFQILYLEKSR